MKKTAFIHFSFLVSFFIILSLVNNWLSLAYWPLWLGGAIGSILPELDCLVYVFFQSPQELSSLRVVELMKQRKLAGAVKFLIETAPERTDLVFHTPLFLFTLYLLLFWLVTSSGSIFGKGIVFAMLMHLITGDTLKKKYSIWFSLIGYGILLVLGVMA